MIAEDIYNFEYIPEDSTLFYFKNVRDDNTGELYIHLNGASRLISNDVHVLGSTYYSKDGQLLYMKNRDLKAGTFEVYGYKENHTFLIAGKAAAYYYTEDSKLYYLDNFDAELGYGDIMKYNRKGDATLIYKGANALFPVQHGYLF